VIVEIFVLALASTVRPTSLAAVYALVFHDSRRRLMSAYVVAGLLFTLTFGAIVVAATHGIHLHSGTNKTKGIADIAGGILALALGVAIWSGRIGAHRDDDVPVPGGGTTSRLDRHLTTRTAALAGPATHIPGLFYLIALNVIIAHEAAVADKAVALVTYNVVWFALPLAALVACIVHPAAARGFVSAVDQWTRQHARTILLVVSLGAGTALVIRGVLTL
jgi:Sap, sulfolipid-1-addressing protein